MEEHKEIWKNIMTQYPPRLLNSITYCHEGEYVLKNVGKKHFLQHKVKHKNSKEVYTDGSKIIGKKMDFVAVFTDITSRRAS